ncbi:MAG: hypothetical protein ACLRL6_05940 [Clostridium sp.]
MQTASIWECKGYTMRSSRIEDKDAYYLAGFTECDSEVARMTGSKMHYSKEVVDAYFVNCLNDSTRYDFLIFDPQGSLIGESVINEIDEQARSANFRICIFKSKTAERESAAGRFKQQETSPFASESCTDFHWMCSHSIYGPKSL